MIISPGVDGDRVGFTEAAGECSDFSLKTFSVVIWRAHPYLCM
jgi:hypothetical protein